MRYTRAFTTAGVCAPSRAALIMGVHQNRFGAGHMRAAPGGYVAVPPPDWKAFPELLRAAGYFTANSGKTDYQMSARLGGAWGGPFTIWDRDGGMGEGFFSDSFALWEGRAPGQPFFGYLTLGGTHESQIWPTLAARRERLLLVAAADARAQPLALGAPHRPRADSRASLLPGHARRTRGPRTPLRQHRGDGRARGRDARGASRATGSPTRRS